MEGSRLAVAALLFASLCVQLGLARPSIFFFFFFAAKDSPDRIRQTRAQMSKRARRLLRTRASALVPNHLASGVLHYRHVLVLARPLLNNLYADGPRSVLA